MSKHLRSQKYESLEAIVDRISHFVESEIATKQQFYDQKCNNDIKMATEKYEIETVQLQTRIDELLKDVHSHSRPRGRVIEVIWLYMISYSH